MTHRGSGLIPRAAAAESASHFPRLGGGTSE